MNRLGRSSSRWALPTIWMLLSFTVVGCGYQLGHPVGAISNTSIAVAIPTFRNSTDEPKLDVKITESVRQAFLKTQGIRLVSRLNEADLVITGRILRYRTPMSAFDSRSTVEQDVEFDVAIQVERLRPTRLLWRDTINASAAFYLGPDIALNRSAQDRATEEAGKVFAQNLVSQFLDRLDASFTETKSGRT